MSDELISVILIALCRLCDFLRSKRLSNVKMDIAFSMFPTTIDELIAVADEAGLMPPKSTWFEPKLRSGFFIHTF